MFEEWVGLALLMDSRTLISAISLSSYSDLCFLIREHVCIKIPLMKALWVHHNIKGSDTELEFC